MSTFKDALCLLAIFIAYGLAGHMDCEDAVMLEEAQRQMLPSASTECWPTDNSLTGNSAGQVRHMRGDPQSDDLPEPAFGRPPEAIALCTPAID
ncbi:MAG: hypothetical protein Q7K57_19985 [Burkholderiaceae bacterium]|nr:hypothetical protein [Burkholderiaceae bacterium]